MAEHSREAGVAPRKQQEFTGLKWQALSQGDGAVGRPGLARHVGALREVVVVRVSQQEPSSRQHGHRLPGPERGGRAGSALRQWCLRLGCSPQPLMCRGRAGCWRQGRVSEETRVWSAADNRTPQQARATGWPDLGARSRHRRGGKAWKDPGPPRSTLPSQGPPPADRSVGNAPEAQRRAVRGSALGPGALAHSPPRAAPCEGARPGTLQAEWPTGPRWPSALRHLPAQKPALHRSTPSQAPLPTALEPLVGRSTRAF